MTLADALGWTSTMIAIVTLLMQLAGIREHHVACAAYAVGYRVGYIGNILSGSQIGAVVDAVLAVTFTYLWWRNRGGKGRGRKALRELGAKSRARVEALARQMSPSPIPSPAGSS